MKGIGTDIVQIARIRKAYEAQPERFVLRVLSKKEIEIFNDRKQSISFLANRFAAKEALAKALGTGIAKGVNFVDLEILPDAFGAPIVSMHGKAKTIFAELGANEAKVSLSDEKDYAVAFAVLI